MESFRNTDMKAEEQLAVFMDRCFYSKVPDKNGKPINFKRIHDKKIQLNGVDIKIMTSKGWINIDEKASLYYSNVMIPTFAFEIDSIQDGHLEPVEGWFINSKLDTDYYMLIWPNIKCEQNDKIWIRKDLNQIQSYDFTIVEAMLIEKNRLVNEMYSLGYDKNYLVGYSKKIRQLIGDEPVSYSESIDSNIKIMLSGKLAEKPVNIVIQKELLKEVASATYLISEDGYARI